MSWEQVLQMVSAALCTADFNIYASILSKRLWACQIIKFLSTSMTMNSSFSLDFTFHFTTKNYYDDFISDLLCEIHNDKKMK